MTNAQKEKYEKLKNFPFLTDKDIDELLTLQKTDPESFKKKKEELGIIAMEVD